MKDAQCGSIFPSVLANWVTKKKKKDVQTGQLISTHFPLSKPLVKLSIKLVKELKSLPNITDQETSFSLREQLRR